MIIHKTLEPHLDCSHPAVLSIGSFDGVHLGHQSLLKHLRENAGPNGTVAVLTFSNHPSHILPNRNPVPQICSPSLKLDYLKKAGVNITYLLEFTKELADMRYDAFLQNLKAAFPFDLLILGEGATLGKKREGTPEKIRQLEAPLSFSTLYIPKQTYEERNISSGTIRTCIQTGNLKKASALLGRPYILEGTLSPTGELQLPSRLCLPPDGDYPILLDELETILTFKDGCPTLQLFTLFPREKVQLLFI